MMQASRKGQVVAARSLRLRRETLIREIMRVNRKITEVKERIAVLEAHIWRLTPTRRKAA